MHKLIASAAGLISLPALALLATMAPTPAHAVLSCTTTDTATSGVAIAGSVLLTPGTCIDAGDKTFGNFAISGALNGTGSATFNFTSVQGDIGLSFQGSVGPSQSGTFDYEVAINPALAGNFLIHDIEKDFTFNSNPVGSPASATLTATTPVAISCTRTVNTPGAPADTCPISANFSPLMTDISVDQTITAGTNAVVTALTDTISQAVPTPEPASLGLLGVGLLGIGLVRWRRQA